jgi:hypothetical protein
MLRRPILSMLFDFLSPHILPLCNAPHISANRVKCYFKCTIIGALGFKPEQ